MSTRIALTAAVAALLALPGVRAQVPGDYPHLQLTDGVAKVVPPPGGPWDNSHVYQAFAGQPFEARISYASAGQPNTNVLFALIVSAAKTPLPVNVTPPTLLAMPPLILLLPTPPNLDVTGHGALDLFVPAGILDAQTYVQGLVYDVTSVPALRLSNGLTVDVDVPGLSVDFSWVRAAPATDDETLVRDFGRIVLGPDELPQLKPVGPQAPPEAIPGEPFYSDDVRFLPLVPNAGDAPVNPLAHPFTRMKLAATGTDTTLFVQDTSHFPPRGRLYVAFGNSNLWADKANSGLPPKMEVVAYDGKLPDAFLNCQRVRLGTSGASGTPTTVFTHVVGEMVIGDWTFATTAGARARTRIGLDVDAPDMPHVVIPAFSVDTGEGGPVDMDLDLYLFETKVDQVQGFVVFDRVTSTWRVIADSLRNTVQGRWNPMICCAPDGRSFLAELVVPGGTQGWDSAPNVLVALRTDGQAWPASGSETWEIPYQIGPDPTITATNVRSRRIIMPATAIIGPDPANYVAFVGLAHKWKLSTTPGAGQEKNVGLEAEWTREEVLVRDYVEVPLVPPGSAKAPPAAPRPYITTQFGATGLGNLISRFDPEVLPSPDHTRLLLVAGGGNNADDQEDAFVIRNVAITSAGTVNKVVGNVTGYSNNGNNAGETALRPLSPGGHGTGGKAAFSPDGTRVAFVAKRNAKLADWINIAASNGASYGTVKNVYDSGNDTFKESGAYTTDRVVSGLRFAGNDDLVFVMGKNPYDDPIGNTAANAPAFDVFHYDIGEDVMTNLSLTSGAAGGFTSLGRIAPAGFFASRNGDFAYVLRAGGISATGGSPLPVGTAVLNLLGVNLDTLDAFPVTGTELDDSALVPDLFVPPADVQPAIETAAAMHFIEGSGVQDGLLWFTAQRQGGNGSEELFAFNAESPFVVFQATQTSKSGLRLSNVTPHPWGGKVAFARTDDSNAWGATQHPFVVDLDNFLFERDLLPVWTAGGKNLGRVMDGSFHFLPPAGTAGDALVFSFGLSATPNGTALLATPAYFALAGVSDQLSQPVPVVIGLIDTFLLGTDFRFYLPYATVADG